MLLALLIGVWILYLLQDRLFFHYWNKELSVRLSFSDKYTYEGDSSSLKEIVTNNKKMPIPALSVRLALNRDLEFINSAKENSTTSDFTYKRDVFSFISKQQITRTLPVLCKKRGYYHFDKVDVVANNFFFKESTYISLPQDTSLFVYPAQISTQKISLICREISGTILTQNKLYPDPFEFYGIREYQRTDPIKFINWKSSARTGDLMVNQFDSTTNIKVTILFDIEDSNIMKQDYLVEETIRIVSSLTAKLATSNMPITIKSNAMDYTNQQPISEFIPAGAGKIMEMNQKLACIDSDNIAFSGEELLRKEMEASTTGNSYVFISKNTKKNCLEAARLLAANTAGLLWVYPISAYDDSDSLSDIGINFLRWEVM